MLFLNDIIDPICKSMGEFGEYLFDINVISISIRLILACLVGGVIGIERSTKKHAAGLRTYILVCMGSALAMLVNQFAFLAFPGTDGSRIGAQVISGIGFLGVGTIVVTSRNRIKGLTTAAGIWACACIGLSLGAGFYTAAIIATLISMVTFTLLPSLENFFVRHTKTYELHIELETRQDLKKLITFLREEQIHVKAVERNAAYESSGLSVYTLNVVHHKAKHKNQENDLLEQLRKLEYVNFVEEIY